MVDHVICQVWLSYSCIGFWISHGKTDRQTDRQTEKQINAAEYPTTRLPSVYNSAIGTRVGLVSYYIPCVVLIILCQWRCFHCFV